MDSVDRVQKTHGIKKWMKEEKCDTIEENSYFLLILF